MGFYLGKIIGVLLEPLNLFCLLLLIAAGMAVSRRRRWQHRGAHFCMVLACFLLFMGVVPVGNWLLTPLENQFKPDYPKHVDGIMILGGDEDPVLSEARGEAVLHDSTLRYVRMAQLLHFYPDAKLLFTGGNPSGKTKKGNGNAFVAQKMLAALGIPPERVIYEDVSRTTYENAVMSFDQVKPGPDENWILITSAFHMPRSIGTFRAAGWRVYPAPTDFKTKGTYGLPDRPFWSFFNLAQNMHLTRIAVHEYLGLLAYWLDGKMDELWPA